MVGVRGPLLPQNGEKMGRLLPAVPAMLSEPLCDRFYLGRSWISHQCAAGMLTVQSSLAQLQEKKGLEAVFLMTKDKCCNLSGFQYLDRICPTR